MKKIILGPPGSGKGTAASRISPKRKIPHISTGDLLRENIREKTPLGIKAQEFINKGEFVPDKIVIEMLKERILEKDCKKGFIIDGFPRNLSQAKKLEKITNMDLVITMNIPEEITIKRISGRVICSGCGKGYHIITIKPKKEGICDVCGNSLIRRNDDEPKIIKQRLITYKEQTEPLIEFYKNKTNVRNIICNDINQTPEETFLEVLGVIEKFEKEKNK